MNYILAGLCILILLNPIGVSMRERQMVKTQRTTVEPATKEERDNDEQIEQSAEF